MIINEENKNSAAFKGTMLRGFNNTPANIRDNIAKTNQIFKQYKQNVPNNVKENKEFDPKKQRELMTKINRINK